MNNTSIETYSGRRVDLTDVRDVRLDDLVHSLSNVCRYGGHSRVFYSVAEHSIYCHDEAVRRNLPKMVCLAVLLHDAGEAYWQDLTRPHKLVEGMGTYLRFSALAQEAVERWFDPLLPVVAVEWRETIKVIDDAVLKAEVLRLMRSRGRDWRGLDEIEPVSVPRWKWIWYRLPGRARAGFRKRLQSYS